MENLIKPSRDEQIYIYSMGKKLRVTAIATNDEVANKHMARTEDAVVACFGPLVIMADKYDSGV